MLTKKSRQSFEVDGIEIPYDIKEILDFIEKNIYGKLTVYDIASAVGKSESTVKNLFSSYKSGGIIKYFNRFMAHFFVFCNVRNID
jgi:AraC-like DNA-binding protein